MVKISDILKELEAKYGTPEAVKKLAEDFLSLYENQITFNEFKNLYPIVDERQDLIILLAILRGNSHYLQKMLNTKFLE